MTSALLVNRNKLQVSTKTEAKREIRERRGKPLFLSYEEASP